MTLPATPVSAESDRHNSGVVAGAAGVRLRARLQGPERSGRIVHRGPQAVYVEADGWCVGVLASAATAVPCAIRTALPQLGVLADATRARVGDGTLWLDDQAVRIGRLVQTTVPPLDPVHPALVGIVLDTARPAADELGDLVQEPLPGLLGRGSGLTPLADDVLCGWLATGRALGQPLEDLPDPRPRTTLLSATLVDGARHGEVIPQFRSLVQALGTGERSAVQRAAADVAAVGHTSGTGLLLGAGLRLEAALGEQHQSPLGEEGTR